jgi:hypothetical protein
LSTEGFEKSLPQAAREDREGNEVEQIRVTLVRIIGYKRDGRRRLVGPRSVPGKSLEDATTGRPESQEGDSGRGADNVQQLINGSLMQERKIHAGRESRESLAALWCFHRSSWDIYMCTSPIFKTQLLFAHETLNRHC